MILMFEHGVGHLQIGILIGKKFMDMQWVVLTQKFLQNVIKKHLS